MTSIILLGAIIFAGMIQGKLEADKKRANKFKSYEYDNYKKHYCNRNID